MYYGFTEGRYNTSGVALQPVLARRSRSGHSLPMLSNHKCDQRASFPLREYYFAHAVQLRFNCALSATPRSNTRGTTFRTAVTVLTVVTVSVVGTVRPSGNGRNGHRRSSKKSWPHLKVSYPSRDLTGATTLAVETSRRDRDPIVSDRLFLLQESRVGQGLTLTHAL